MSRKLCEQYPTLYNIVPHKGDTLAKVMDSVQPTLMFRWDLVGPRLASWNDFLQRLAHVHMTSGSDGFKWNLIENHKFSVNSMYKALIQPVEPTINNKFIWKMKVPLKTKLFAWYPVLFLPKITLQNSTGMDVRNVFLSSK
jgi:hypothetical protein